LHQNGEYFSVSIVQVYRFVHLILVVKFKRRFRFYGGIVFYKPVQETLPAARAGTAGLFYEKFKRTLLLFSNFL